MDEGVKSIPGIHTTQELLGVYFSYHRLFPPEPHNFTKNLIDKFPKYYHLCAVQKSPFFLLSSDAVDGKDGEEPE